MNKFKVGDKVRCIDDDCAYALKKGKAYIITKVLDTGSLGFKGAGSGWFPERFEKIKSNGKKQ